MRLSWGDQILQQLGLVAYICSCVRTLGVRATAAGGERGPPAIADGDGDGTGKRKAWLTPSSSAATTRSSSSRSTLDDNLSFIIPVVVNDGGMMMGSVLVEAEQQEARGSIDSYGWMRDEHGR